MRIHVHPGGRYSLNGTANELRAVSERLIATIAQMDEHEERLADVRAERQDMRGPGGHFVDFHLDEIDGVDILEES